jgi:hypothetical protein
MYSKDKKGRKTLFTSSSRMPRPLAAWMNGYMHATAERKT